MKLVIKSNNGIANVWLEYVGGDVALKSSTDGIEVKTEFRLCKDGTCYKPPDGNYVTKDVLCSM